MVAFFFLAYHPFLSIDLVRYSTGMLYKRVSSAVINAVRSGSFSFSGSPKKTHEPLSFSFFLPMLADFVLEKGHVFVTKSVGSTYMKSVANRPKIELLWSPRVPRALIDEAYRRPSSAF